MWIILVCIHVIICILTNMKSMNEAPPPPPTTHSPSLLRTDTVWDLWLSGTTTASASSCCTAPVFAKVSRGQSCFLHSSSHSLTADLQLRLHCGCFTHRSVVTPGQCSWVKLIHTGFFTSFLYYIVLNTLLSLHHRFGNELTCVWLTEM